MKTLTFIFLISIIPSCSDKQEEALKLLVKGDQLHKKGEYAEALDCFFKAKKIYPKLNYVDYNIGCSYFEMGDYKKSIEYFDNAINNDSLDHISHFFKAHALLNLYRPNEAMIEIDIGFNLDSSEASAYFIKGMALFQLEDFEGALKQHNKAIELNPNDYDYYIKRSAAIDLVYGYEHGLNDLYKAIKINPHYSDAYLYLADSYYNLNQKDSCCLFLAKLYEIEPNMKIAYLDDYCN